MVCKFCNSYQVITEQDSESRYNKYKQKQKSCEYNAIKRGCKESWYWPIDLSTQVSSHIFHILSLTLGVILHRKILIIKLYKPKREFQVQWEPFDWKLIEFLKKNNVFLFGPAIDNNYFLFPSVPLRFYTPMVFVIENSRTNCIAYRG